MEGMREERKERKKRLNDEQVTWKGKERKGKERKGLDSKQETERKLREKNEDLPPFSAAQVNLPR